MQIHQWPSIQHLKCQLPESKAFIGFIHCSIPGAQKSVWSIEGAH